MNYLIIGGTGTISGGIAEEALRQGHDVTIVNRGNRDYRIPHGAQAVHANINDRKTLRTILEKKKYDIVVDPLVMRVAQLKRHLKTFDGLCGTYVFISSCCAFGCHEGRIDESHTMSPKSKYGVDKLKCEKYLKTHRIRSKYLIIRPYITYGDIRIPIPFACRGNPYTVIDRILNNKPLVCFETDQHRTEHNLMDIRDFSRLFVAVTEKSPMNTDYNICGDHVYTWMDAYDILYEKLGREKHLYYVDRELFKYVDLHLYEDIIYDKDSYGAVYACDKAKAIVDKQPAQISLRQGISDLVDYQKENCAGLPLEKQFNYRTDLLLVNGVAEKDGFLNDYLSSLSPDYVRKLQADWQSLKNAYRYKKLPVYPLVKRVRSKLFSK